MATATRPAIARIWRGRTRPDRADEYERYNYEAGIKPLIEKAMGVQTLREDRATETEFVTVSYWESVEAMSRFTGGDPTRIHHLDRDAEFLIELPTSVQILRIRAAHGDTGGGSGVFSEPQEDSRVRITRDDARYRTVVDKHFNKRFAARPDYVRLAASTDDVIAAVNEAVGERRRLVVTSGGHCLEGFVTDSDVRVIVDVTPMKRIEYDAERRAVMVEGGATVGDTFRALAERWGVVIPLGEYPHIGMGGHVVGGAFGFLCRQLGLAADYLYGVEVVAVNQNGRAARIVATRESSDPNRDLWWAHTGGGGGNFGIATRYWFRSPDATGSDPSTLLPRAPQSVVTFNAAWNWEAIDRACFQRLLQNHGNWCERNSGVDATNLTLWTLLEIHRRQFGKILARGVSTDPAADRQIDAYFAALSDGVSPPTGRELTRMPWLEFALNPFPDLFAMPPGGVRVKVKDALLRRRLSDQQIGAAYEHLTRADCNIMGGMLGLATYGGAVNRIAPDATASSQRGSILDLACSTGWLDGREDDINLRWVRELYRDLFSGSGGVPVPGDAYDGALINHPDTDLADASLNTSGTPWHALYYRNNYARLQQIKRRWDPLNVFHHALSIRPD